MSRRLAALLALAASGAYLAFSLPLPRGTGARPGPGSFPLGVGVLLCFTAIAFVIQSFRRGTTDTRTPHGPDAAAARARVWGATGGVVGFCLLLPWAGYPAAAFLFVALVLRRLGTGWTAAVVGALASAAGSHYLFAILLGVPLPSGAWLD